MDRFFGFDLGDAESAIARLIKEEQNVPEMLTVVGEQSFITAYARLTNGELLVGEKACYADDVVKRKLRFKSRFLTDRGSAEDIKSFAAGVLGELYGSGDLIKNEECSFYIGCPAGWDKNTREHYREIFESAGYPPAGGLMDEILLEESVASAGLHKKKVQSVFNQSEPWRTYAEFAARRLKEKYYSDEDYWSKNSCQESIVLHYDRPVKLVLKMDAKTADKLVNKKIDKLGRKSWKEVFISSLEDVKRNITGSQPELIFLTGGVSKLPAIRDWCSSVFKDAVVISATDPEFSVARGLSYCGRIDEDLKEFKADIDELIASSAIEDVVSKHIPELYRDAVDTLVDPIVKEVAVPVFDRWRAGEIKKLADTDEILQTEVSKFLHSDETRELLAGPITSWLRPVIEELESLTVPICLKHRVPYTALSLKSYLNASDIDIKVDAKNIFAVEEMTFLIDSLVTAVVAILVATIDLIPFLAGPEGVIIGIMASIAVLFLGKDKMQETLLTADIPKTMRRLIPKGAFSSRTETISADIKESFYETLKEEKNDEISERMINEITTQIESTLAKMAEVVEIPLGQ